MADTIISELERGTSCYNKAVQVDKQGNNNGILDGQEIRLFNKALLETYYLSDGASFEHGIRTGKIVANHCGGGSHEVIETLHVSEADLDKYLIPDEVNEEILNGIKGSLEKNYVKPKKLEDISLAVNISAPFISSIALGGIFEGSLAAAIACGGVIAVSALAVVGLIVYGKKVKKDEIARQEQEISNLMEQNNIKMSNAKQRTGEEACSFANSSLMGEKVGNDIGLMMAQNGFRDLEVANLQEDINQLFMKKGNDDVEVKFTKTDDNTFAGMISVSNCSKSELYIFKAEYVETNKSKKLKLSKMRVVQDGVDDNSEVHKKFLKETVETQRTKESHSESNSLDASLGLGFFKIKFGMDSKATSSDYREFERIVTEQLPEGKEVTIYSISK